MTSPHCPEFGWRIALHFRTRGLEGRVLATGGIDAKNGGIGVERSRHPTRIIELRDEAEIGKPGPVAMAEAPRPTARRQLEARLAELPMDKEVVAYCRGPYCVFSLHALEVLRARGFRARRLEEGIPDWRALGLPIATGPHRAGEA